MQRTTTLITGLLVCATAAQALGQTVRAVDLGTLYGPTRATAINAHGVVAGVSITDIASGSRYNALRWESGVLTRIPPAGGDLDSHAFDIGDDDTAYGSSFAVGRLGVRAFAAGSDGVPVLLGAFSARGANDAGEVVGSRPGTTPNGLRTRVACVYRDGQLLTLPGLGGQTSVAAAITDAGDIVGWASTADEMHTHATLWRSGATHDLGTLGGSRSQALAVNDSGAVAGVGQTANGHMHAMLLQTDDAGNVVSRTDLGVLGGNASTALGINDAGHVVGTSDDRAFLFSEGQMIDLNTRLPPDSAWVLQGATAISNAGLITGWGRHHGVPAAFLLTPCDADFDNNGSLNTRDVLAFLNAWNVGSISADFNDDGSINSLDVLAFLNAWNTGC